MWWWLAVALAAPPDGAPETFPLGAGAADGLTVSGDGRFVAAIANGAVHLLDTDDWSVESIAPCAATSVAMEFFAVDTHYVWVGCDDGDARLLLWDRGDFGIVTSEGEPITYDLGGEAIHGVWTWDTGGLVYVLSDATDGDFLELHVIEADSGLIDQETGFPLQVPFTGYVEGVPTQTRLLLFHGGSQVSQLNWGSSGILPNLQNYPYDVADAGASIRDSAYTASDDVIAEYMPSSFVYTVIATGLEDADAVAASISTDDEWLVVSGINGVGVFGLEDGVPTGTTPLHQFDPLVRLDDLVVARWGYAFGGTVDGSLLVLTANPWVTDVTLDPPTPSRGETVTLSFTVDAAVEYEVFLGGDATGSGTSLDVGSLASAGTATVQIQVDDRFVEGDNHIYALVEDGANLVGHGVAHVVLDEPPTAPDVSVQARDGALDVRVETDMTDLDSFDVYVTVAPFDPAAYPTGGPPFDGSDALTTPVTGDADADGDATIRISPLRNDVTYYIAVRATDEAGQEGAMSEVVQGAPRPLETATGASGEEGGRPSCACSSAGPGGALGAIALAFAFLRRRRSLLLAALMVPGVASAQQGWGDTTPAWANFEIRYGNLLYKEPSAIVDVYGKTGHDQFTFEMGGQIFRFFEVDYGIGFYRDSTFERDDDGVLSDEGTALALWPMYLDATGRLHFWDEQPFVPFARIGLDYILWREVVGQSGGTRTATSGGKIGWHWGVGGQLLLDVFAPRRASLLEASTGINDSWLTLEWRRQYVEPGQFLFLENTEGLSFTGDLLQVGLKIDY